MATDRPFSVPSQPWRRGGQMLAGGWTILVAALFVVGYRAEHEAALELARSEAATAFDMTHQAHALARATEGPHSRVTSLHPIRPQYAADAWEEKALRAFETGMGQVSGVELLEGRPCLRLMRPLTVEASCLACHDRQDFRIGSIRGGISVAVPLAPYLAVATRHIRRDALVLALLWGLGGFGLIASSRRIRYHVERHLRAQELLHESSEVFRATFDQAAAGIAHVCADGRLLRVNQQFCDIVGYPRQKMLTLTLGDLTPPEDRESDLVHLQALLRGETPSFLTEKRYLRKDGTLVWANLSMALVHDAQGEIDYVIAVIIDITDRKRAEQALRASEDALRESEEKYRSLTEGSPEGIAVFQNDRLVFANSAMAEMSGYSLDQLLRLSWDGLFTLVDPSQRQPLLGKLQARLDGHASAGLGEIRFRRKDGAWAWLGAKAVRIQYSGRPAVQVSFIDITRIKQAEAALLESEERYRRITEAVTDYIYTVRIENGKPVDTLHSEGCLAVTGYTAAELKADPPLWHRLIQEADRDAVAKHSLRVVAGEDMPPLEHRIVRKDGAVRWVRNTPVPHRRADGALLGFDGLIRDITEQKEAEVALRRERDLAESLIETAPSIVLMLDGQARIVRFNRCLEELSGYSLDEARGRDWVALLFPPTDRERIRRVFLDTIEHLETRGNVYPILAKDGRLRQIEWYSKTFLDDRGRVAGVLVIGQDVTDRERAEEALRESEERFRRTFDDSPIGAAIVDLDFRFQRVNTELCRITGYTASELVGRSFADITHPDDLTSSLESSRRLRSGEIADFQMEKRYLRKDGQTIWGRVSARLIKDGAGRPLYFLPMIEDITARIRSEEARSVSEQRFVSLFANMAEGVALHELVFDSRGTPIDYRIVDVNSRYESILGLSRHRVVGSLASEVYAAPEPPFLGVFVGVAMKGRPFYFESQFPTMDRYFAISVAPLGTAKFATIFSDISERRHAEEILAESEERHRMLFETMLHGVIYRDADGRITSINPAAERILGHHRAALIGRTAPPGGWLAVREDGTPLPDGDQPALVALRQRKPVRDVTLGVFNPQEGRLRWLIANELPQFRPGQDQPYQVYGTLVDITERKRADAMAQASRRGT